MAHVGFVVLGCAVGSALIGFWLVARYRTFGPKTLGPSFLLCGIAFGLLRATGLLTRLMVDAVGPVAALLGLVVPILVFTFWSAGVLVRVSLGARSPA
jgi:hypothetical protein